MGRRPPKKKFIFDFSYFWPQVFGSVLPRTLVVRGHDKSWRKVKTSYHGMPPSGDGRSRGWCFTLNNYTAADCIAIKAIECNYLIYGRETGEQGTPHLQGYVQFATKKSLLQLKKLLPKAHLETTKGSIKSNIRYCSKEDPEPVEKGKRPLDAQEKGRINKEKWANLRALAKAGDLETIGQNNPQVWVQNYRTLKLISKDHMEKPDPLEFPCGEWIWGEAGLGKTHLPRTKYPDAFIKDRTKWWDGYQGQEVAILDDIDPYCVSLAALVKDWGDKWPIKVEDKGSAMFIRPKKFIITSQYPPEGIWKDPETLDAINRRYNVIHMTGKPFKKKKRRPPSEFLTLANCKKHKYRPPSFIENSHDCKKHGTRSQEVPEEKAPLFAQEEDLQEADLQEVQDDPSAGK